MSITRRYQLVSASRVILGPKVTQFVHHRELEVTFGAFGATSKQFKVRVVRQHVEGAGLLHRFTEDLEATQSRLHLDYHPTTGAVKVMNHPAILRGWNDGTHDELRERYQMRGGPQMVAAADKLLHDPAAFEASLIGYNHLRTLLNPHVKYQDDLRPLRLPGFFGSGIDLCLTVETLSDPEGNLRASAIVDAENMDAPSLRRMVRDVAHAFDLRAGLRIEMEEVYEFTALNTPAQVDLFLKTDVADGYYVSESAHQLKMLEG